MLTIVIVNALIVAFGCLMSACALKERRPAFAGFMMAWTIMAEVIQWSPRMFATSYTVVMLLSGVEAAFTVVLIVLGIKWYREDEDELPEVSYEEYHKQRRREIEMTSYDKASNSKED